MIEPTFSGDLGLLRPMQLYRLLATEKLAKIPIIRTLRPASEQRPYPAWARRVWPLRQVLLVVRAHGYPFAVFILDHLDQIGELLFARFELPLVEGSLLPGGHFLQPLLFCLDSTGHRMFQVSGHNASPDGT